MGFEIDRVDHIVINCRDLETTVAWYQRVLGLQREEFAYGDHTHVALKYGRQKFNVRPTGTEHWWSVDNDAPGSLDICLITTSPIDDVIAHLAACEVEIAKGPVPQIGALGPMTSVYFYDPDRNLIEVAVYS
ncbi:VOC family protein [Thalassobaculum sp. OXR-137]|uniref:VOC family protein n=1 Tax=Thalassobaculum sp. OXR-137 TaxID=3100173 RepID=UPI002AC94CDA|nr:VOC family protein [Thalassobaculum sp. OXR-137]WPZ33972.1 VOC family protein [Thalassobaculum sp. OXR-137]